MANAIFARMLDRGPRIRPPTMRVDHWFYQASQDNEADPISTSYSSLSGEGWALTPKRLVWNANGQPSTLSLGYLLGSREAATRVRPEEAHQRVGNGDRIVLRQERAGDHPGERLTAEWFRGHVAQERPLIQAHPDVEAYEVMAFGPEILLAGKPVLGQWCKTVAADDLHMAGTLTDGTAAQVVQTYLPAVFNPKGQPNAANVGFDLAGDLAGIPAAQQDACRVFDAPGRKVIYDSAEKILAEHWTAYTAIRSLIEQWDGFDVISPFTDWGFISDMLSDQVIGSVNVQGMSLLQALRAILLPIGFGFAIEPWADPHDLRETGKVRHRLIVFSLYNPPALKTPRLADVRGGMVDVSVGEGQRIEVQRLDFLRDASHVRNDVVVVGDVRRRTVCLYFGAYGMDDDLVPFWDTTVHTLITWTNGESPAGIDPSGFPDTEATRQQFFDRFHMDGKDHAGYKHVFRSFVWNEDGAAADVSGLTVPDLSDLGIGDDTNFVRRPRPLAPTRIFDDSTAKLRLQPVKIELGIVLMSGPTYVANSWIEIPATVFAVRAGFSISRQKLAGDDAENWCPYRRHESLKDTYGNLSYLTLLYNSLNSVGTYGLALRITGSVETDEAVTGEAGRILGTVWPHTARRVVYAPNRFKRHDVRDDPWSAGAARHDTRDDRADAAMYAQLVRNAGQNALGHGSLTLRFLTRAYRIGDGISRTAGRQVQFHSDSGDQGATRYPVVLSVAWEFTEGVNKTELALDSPALQLTR